MISQSFPPIVDDRSNLVILGTMPSVHSLKSKEYYAHSDNLFWDIIYRVFIKDWPMSKLVNTPFAEKSKLILANKLALWDVINLCEREGSLDTKIINEESNNLPYFFKQYPNIKTIIFNGQRAHKYFLKAFPKLLLTKNYFIFQSTSPSNQTNAFKILKEWKQLNKLVNG